MAGLNDILEMGKQGMLVNQASIQIAGKNIANPYSMIGSVALMLEKSFGEKKAANALWQALFSVFGAGYRTQELASHSTATENIISTRVFGDKTCEQLLS